MVNYEVIWKDKTNKKNTEVFADLMAAMAKADDLIRLGFDAWLVLCNNGLDSKLADFHVIRK